MIAFSATAWQHAEGQALNVAWSRQFGSGLYDNFYSIGGFAGDTIEVDGAGNAYVTGWTSGSLQGLSNGGSDAFLRKYDPLGSVLWTRQIGTASHDKASALDVTSGGDVFVTGFTNGSLSGPHLGGSDSFLQKYDAAGTLIWSRQFGTSFSEPSEGVAVDASGNSYVLAAQNPGTNVRLTKFDPLGSQAWTTTFGSNFNDERPTAIDVDVLGNVYVTGSTDGNLAGPLSGRSDIFLAKYDPLGNQTWIRQFGSSNQFDQSTDLVVSPNGNVTITGWVQGTLPGANNAFHGGPTDSDGFVASFSPAGTQLWATHLGSSNREMMRGVTALANNDVVVTGVAATPLAGPHAGANDVPVFRFDSTGTQLWTTQLGTAGDERGAGAAATAAGDVFLTGTAYTSFAGGYTGQSDIWVVKLEPPRPPAITLSGLRNFDVVSPVGVDVNDFHVTLNGITDTVIGGSEITSVYPDPVHNPTFNLPPDWVPPASIPVPPNSTRVEWGGPGSTSVGGQKLHFGVTLNQLGRQNLQSLCMHWTFDGAPVFVGNDPTLPITITANHPAPGEAPIQIVNQTCPEHPGGGGRWLGPIGVNVLDRSVALDELLADDPIVQAATPIVDEFSILQAGETYSIPDLDAGSLLANDGGSILIVYDVYAVAPDGGVGDYVGTSYTAFNATVVPEPSLDLLALSASLIGSLLCRTSSRPDGVVVRAA
ncbi:MAG: SBBP repeat-containing protein [Planctomycetales bacterium]|nr:SBBP repeat-containing protein [Planctomycetales bacterium]